MKALEVAAPRLVERRDGTAHLPLDARPGSAAAPAVAVGRRPRGRGSWWVWLAERAVCASGMLSIAIVLLILAFLVKDAMQVFRHVAPQDFLAGRDWHPLSDEFGILPLILGSLYVTAGAVAIAVPLGVACALYLREVAPPWVREVMKPAIEMLAGVPSVVVGFIGLVLLAPLLQRWFGLPTGLTGLSGSVLLALMALPTIISVAEDALAAVPDEYRLGALALGATRWQALRGVVVPAARSGIVGAVMLGVGRAIGETMTVLMVTGNAASMPHSLLQPMRTMTATIAQEMGETVHASPHYYALFGIGLVLFLITFCINLVADVALHGGMGGRRS